MIYGALSLVSFVVFLASAAFMLSPNIDYLAQAAAGIVAIASLLACYFFNRAARRARRA